MVSNWKTSNITDLLKPNGIKIGPFGSQLKKELFIQNGDYKVYGQENVYAQNFKIGDRYMTRSHFDKLRSCELFPGDFVMSTMGTVGKCAIVPAHITRGIMDSHLIRLRFDEKVIDKTYLLQLFSPDIQFLKDQTDKLSVGGIMDGLSVKIVSSLTVEYPSSVEEQKAIVNALSAADGMISSLEKLIAKKKAVKQGAMQELLTGKKRLPGFAGEWYETTIGEHCCVFDGTHQTPKYTLAGIPFYSVENITANDFVNTKFITTEEHEQLSSKCKIEKGDILMTRIGSIGDCKYIDWDVNASFYVSLALIKCKETINAQFLSFYSTSSYFKKEIEIRSLLTAIPQKINLGPISEIRLNIPSDIKEQEAIASILSDMDDEIEALEQKLAKARQVKQGMMQQLLTGKIRLV